MRMSLEDNASDMAQSVSNSDQLSDDMGRSPGSLSPQLSNVDSTASGPETAEPNAELFEGDPGRVSDLGKTHHVSTSPAPNHLETWIENVKVDSNMIEISNQDLVLPNVSFDNLVGMRGLTSSYYESSGPPHRSKQALIKPDQVSRLPHLNQAQKDICNSQTVALFHRLDQRTDTDEVYKELLAMLENLSRVLMRSLKDWQRERSRAPQIPFSLT